MYFIFTGNSHPVFCSEVHCLTALAFVIFLISINSSNSMFFFLPIAYQLWYAVHLWNCWLFWTSILLFNFFLFEFQLGSFCWTCSLIISFKLCPFYQWGLPRTYFSDSKNALAMWRTQVWFLGEEDPLEKGTVTHSSILAWRIPWIAEPGRLQSMALQTVEHNWMTNTFIFTPSIWSPSKSWIWYIAFLFLTFSFDSFISIFMVLFIVCICSFIWSTFSLEP